MRAISSTAHPRTIRNQTTVRKSKVATIFVFLFLKAFNMVLGRVIHIGVDAILVSTVLAGIKRSTGLQFKDDNIESKEVRSAVNKYLNVGDWVLDQSIAFMSSSSYFERKR